MSSRLKSQEPRGDKFVYISAVTRNRDHVVPKNCAATFKGFHHTFYKNKSVLLEPTELKVSKAPPMVELLRKSEMEAIRQDHEYHKKSPKLSNGFTTKTSNNSTMNIFGLGTYNSSKINFKVPSRKSYIFESLRDLKNQSETLYALKKFRESSMTKLIDGEIDENEMKRVDSPQMDEIRTIKKHCRNSSRAANKNRKIINITQQPFSSQERTIERNEM